MKKYKIIVTWKNIFRMILAKIVYSKTEDNAYEMIDRKVFFKKA